MITTPRLRIGPMSGEFAGSHARALYYYRNLPEVARFQEWAPQTVAEVSQLIDAQANTFLECSGQYYQWGITLQSSPATLIGDFGISLKVEPQQTAEFGIALDPVYQQQGMASEALWYLLDFLFRDKNIHRVIASVDPENGPSMRLMQRLGMRKEAHHVRSYRFNDEWVDDVIFALLADEWPAVQAGR